MPTKTWAAGEDFLAPDINSYLQRQMVLSFANSTERAAEVSNPTVGMVSFLASTGGFEVFTDKTTPPSWRPPWNTAWGLIRGSMVYDVSLGTGAVWIIAHLPVQLPGRQYKIEYDVNVYPANMGNVFIQHQTNVGYDLQALLTIYPNYYRRMEAWNIYPGATTNDHGIIGQAGNDAVTATMNYGRVRVFDVGPV